MRINFFSVKGNFLNSSYERNNSFRTVNYNLFKPNIVGDTFSFSGKGHKLPPLTEEQKKEIIEHYKTHKYIYGAITKFCKAKNIKKHQYEHVIKDSGLEIVHGNTERRKLTPEQIETVRQRLLDKVPKQTICDEFQISSDIVTNIAKETGMEKGHIDEKLMQEIVKAINNNEKAANIQHRLKISDYVYRRYVKIAKKSNLIPDKLSKKIPYEEYTPRVIELRKAGKNNDEIAEELGLPKERKWIVVEIIRRNPDIERIRGNNGRNIRPLEKRAAYQKEKTKLEKKIIELKKENPRMSDKEIAGRLTISKSKVTRIRHGIKDMPEKPGIISDEEIDKIRDLAAQEYTKRMVADELHIKKNTVDYIARTYKISFLHAKKGPHSAKNKTKIKKGKKLKTLVINKNKAITIKRKIITAKIQKKNDCIYVLIVT